ncbi:MAG: FkbM family methyltransferase [Pyrinomonadaceae bacterium]
MTTVLTKSGPATAFVLRLVRAYTRRAPVDKGKYRLMTYALRVCGELPPPEVVAVRDGRRIRADLRTGMHDLVYFFGEYEPAITALVRSLVRPGDVCIDAGANFGWYTTLLLRLVGDKGSVHAFEPIPATFDELEFNVALAGSPANVRINRLALSDAEGEVTFHLFAGEPTGHASMSSGGRSDTTAVSCRTTTLDRYLEESAVGAVDFVKVDVEGAELLMLRGAEALFAQADPPIVVMEMALNTSRKFGCTPDDLIRFIRDRAGYSFYVIDEVRKKLDEIDGFAADDQGANVLCVPHRRRERLAGVRNWLDR